MGEYIPATFQLGGKLPKQCADKYIKLLNDQDMRTDERDEVPSQENLGQTFYNPEINYGNTDELEYFANQLELPWLHWFAAGPDWMPATEKRVGDRYEQCVGGFGNDLYLSESQIKTLGMDGALELLTWMREPLPPLEIV